jgi:hypothetical protein
MNQAMNRLFRLAMVLGMIGITAAAEGASLPVAGSPTYDEATQTGFKDGYQSGVPCRAVNNSGVALGYAFKYDHSAYYSGMCAVRWDISGTAATELGSLGTGAPSVSGRAINDSGTAVGALTKYVDGVYAGYIAVRWDAGGTTATELDSLGVDPTTGRKTCETYAINSAGTIAGYSQKYVDGADKGGRAVRWAAGGTAVTELDTLGTDSSGYTITSALVMNDAGMIAGWAEKRVGANNYGHRAVRWTGTAISELGDLGTDGSGNTNANAQAINATGTVVGYETKYVSGSSQGDRAVRWNAGGTAATELATLGTSGTYGYAHAIGVNDSGTAVGYSSKYVSSSYKGDRAVRWNGTGTTATELATLGTSSTGSANSSAFMVNSAGTAVGYAEKYTGSTLVGNRAVIWLPDASVIDMNTLGVVNVPAGGTWTLNMAKSFSADGYVSGEGMYDPDGAGSAAAYKRFWVTQVGFGGNWTNASGGTWGRGPNWSTGTPAMQIGNATFNLNAAYTVAFDRNEETQNVNVQAGTVALALAGHSLTVDNTLTVSTGATLSIGGSLTGSGGTIVHGTLTATSITQHSLTIGGARAEAAAPVPEPGTFALLISAIAMGWLLARRGRK